MVHQDGESDELEEAPVVHYVGNPLDSRMALFDDVLNEKLEHAFHQHTSQVFIYEIARIASEYDPIDLAYAVTRLPPSARFVLYDNLPDEQAKVIFIVNTGSNTRAAIFRNITDEDIVKLIEAMSLDEAVEILDDLSDRRLKRLFELLDSKKVQRIRELQAHDRHSAARLMTDEFFAFRHDVTLGEVAAAIRQNPGIDLTHRIFVLDDGDALIGYVPGRNLIINPAELPIRQVMQPVTHSVYPDASRDEVVDLVVRYKDSALPVVDTHGALVGVIAQSDVVEAMEDIADETIASIAGTTEDVSEHEPTLNRFFSRAPWLVVTLCAGIVTSTAMQELAGNVWFVALPFFVPLITGMSGNVGIQCSSVLVRGISIGEFSSRSIKEAIFKELAIGLVIASTFGLACGSIVYFLNNMSLHHGNALGLATVVAAGLFCACMTAACLGAFLPFFFVRCRIDPAVASGPIVTAFNDVFSTLIFFLVSWLAFVSFG